MPLNIPAQHATGANAPGQFKPRERPQASQPKRKQGGKQSAVKRKKAR